MSGDYYMASASETAKHPDAAGLFHEIASHASTVEKQRDVFNALWSFWCFEHAFDDVLDAGHLQQDEREKLLHQCANFIHAALCQPEERDAAVWFKANFQQALSGAGMDPDQRRLASRALEDFAGNLVANPFYQKHAQQHLAILDSLIFRAIAGDEMLCSNDKITRTLSPAVRCGDVDFAVHVAKLVGGWNLARKITSERDYDRD